MRFGIHYFWNGLETSMAVMDAAVGKNFIFTVDRLTDKRRVWMLLPSDNASFQNVLDVGTIQRYVLDVRTIQRYPLVLQMPACG